MARVSAVFDDDGSGHRGNLAAVIRSILLDDEARAEPSGPTAGKAPASRCCGSRSSGARMTRKPRMGGTPASTRRTRFGQGPLTAPSVFNFFNPFYAAPGAIADQELVSPELQLATEYQNTLTANFFYKQAFNRTSRSDGVDPDIVVIDIEADMHYAPTSASLVASVANRLLGGEISDPLREEVERQVARVSAWNARQRVSEAIWLIATSPEYAVQR